MSVKIKAMGAYFPIGLIVCSLMPVTPSFANQPQTNNQQLIQSQSVLEQRLFEQAQNLTTSQTILPANYQAKDNNTLFLAQDPTCFTIHRISLDVPNEYFNHFRFLERSLNKKSTGMIGQCIGTQGLQVISGFAQDQLVNQGYITSGIIIKPQDLSTGQLTLSVIPGLVADTYREPDDINLNTHNALTVSDGDVLNLRALEQSVENLRLPHNTRATISVEPTARFGMDAVDDLPDDIGYSDLLIKRQTGSKIGLQVFANNFGNHSTGVYQGGIGVNIAEPLWSNDSLYIQYMHTLDGLNDTPLAADNQNIYLSYRYPFRLWQLQLSYNHNRYTQALNGWNHNPIYKGVTQRKQAKLSRTFFRDGNTKLIGYGVIAHKDSQYHIDDLEILVQRRKTSDYSLGLNLEKNFYNQGKLNLDVHFDKGVAAFHALPSPERYYRDVDSRPLIWQASGNYRLPFNTTHHQFGLNTHFHAQYSNDKLPFADQFTVGDRYSVRGFDGKKHLSGNKGLVVGQEIYYKLPTQNPHQIYFAVDKGWVSTDHSTNVNQANSYHQAVGGVIGYRFGTKHINFDAYIGKPLKSGGHLSKDANVGVQLALTY